MSYFNIKIFETNTFFETKIFQNRYRYFFRYQFFWNRYWYFFWNQNFPKPIPIFFSIPKNFETNTNTFFDTKFFQNRYRSYQNNWKSFEAKNFRNQNITLCPVVLVGPWVWWAHGSGGPVSLVVGPWVWWAYGSSGFCWLLIGKSPTLTLRGPTCQGVLDLVVGIMTA